MTTSLVSLVSVPDVKGMVGAVNGQEKREGVAKGGVSSTRAVDLRRISAGGEENFLMEGGKRQRGGMRIEARQAFVA